ncbi:hypothetical protein M231_02782 [Tremella mesenterica]|uniref:EamA domain-containing protein n=1 Tax=Tremella mesenterica TaxID=5217 RepID=A0A4V1M4D5_TREME|nr:hypothetical protein M231_02782 [Tremella mesenterica]
MLHPLLIALIAYAAFASMDTIVQYLETSEEIPINFIVVVRMVGTLVGCMVWLWLGGIQGGQVDGGSVTEIGEVDRVSSEDYVVSSRLTRSGYMEVRAEDGSAMGSGVDRSLVDDTPATGVRYNNWASAEIRGVQVLGNDEGNDDDSSLIQTNKVDMLEEGEGNVTTVKTISARPEHQVKEGDRGSTRGIGEREGTTIKPFSMRQNQVNESDSGFTGRRGEREDTINKTFLVEHEDQAKKGYEGVREDRDEVSRVMGRKRERIKKWNSFSTPYAPWGKGGKEGIRYLLWIRGIIAWMGLWCGFEAFGYLGLSEALPILALLPFPTAGICWLFLKERFTLIQCVSCVISILGVIIIAQPSFLSPNPASSLPIPSLDPPLRFPMPRHFKDQPVQTFESFYHEGKEQSVGNYIFQQLRDHILPLIFTSLRTTNETGLDRVSTLELVTRTLPDPITHDLTNRVIGISLMSLCTLVITGEIFFTRLIGRRATAVQILTMFAASSVVLSSLLLIISREKIVIPSSFNWIALLAVIPLGGGAQICLTYATQHTTGGQVGMMSYSSVVFGVLSQWGMYRSVPDWPAFVGMSIIVISGLVAVKYGSPETTSSDPNEESEIPLLPSHISTSEV